MSTPEVTSSRQKGVVTRVVGTLVTGTLIGRLSGRGVELQTYPTPKSLPSSPSSVTGFLLIFGPTPTLL